MSVVPEGQTMNTDQRLALLLLKQVEDSSVAVRRYRREIDQWDDDGMKEILNRQAAHIENANKRLVEICEALAAGTLRIVDENEIVRVLASEFEVPTPPPSTGTRRAQLALQQLQFTEAIR